MDKTAGATSADWAPSERMQRAIEEARRLSERMERENEESEAVFSFFASLPTATYLRLSGDGGGRLQLDFDDKQLGEVLKLVLHRNELLEVTVRSVIR